MMITRPRSRRLVPPALLALLVSLLLGVFSGSAAASETPHLSWYECGKSAEGVYENSSCSKKGAVNSYAWLRIPSSTEFASTNVAPNGSSEIFVFGWTGGGIKIELECFGVMTGTGSLINTAAGAEISGYHFALKHCSFSKPIQGCVVRGEEIPFNPLKGFSPQYPETLKPSLILEPAEGETIGEFQVESCKTNGLNGIYSITGRFPATIDNEKSAIATTWAETTAAETLRIRGNKAGLASFNYLSTSGKSVKLDTAP